MSRRHGLLLSAVALVVIGIALLLPFESWPDALLHPWRLLWGSGQQLNATLLEASEGETVQQVGRRLLKPFGSVKLLRIYDTDDKSKS